MGPRLWRTTCVRLAFQQHGSSTLISNLSIILPRLAARSRVETLGQNIELGMPQRSHKLAFFCVLLNNALEAEVALLLEKSFVIMGFIV